MADDKFEKKSMPNVKVLRSFRMRGEAVAVGEVIPKTRFAKKGDWQNLAFMPSPKLEETSDEVGKPKVSGKAGLPGAKT